VIENSKELNEICILAKKSMGRNENEKNSEFKEFLTN